MFFKRPGFGCGARFSRRLCVATLIVTLLGCGLHVGEEAPRAVVPSYDGNALNCVGRIPEHVERYVQDELSEDQIDGFMTCMQNAFVSFARLTRGHNRNVYTPQEIRAFLQKNFLRDREVTDDLLHELMVVKQTLVGGELEHVTRPELYSLVQVLDDIRKEAQRLKPYMKFLNPNLARQQDPREMSANFAAASQALQATIQVFSTRLETSKRDYTFTNLQGLMREWRRFVGWEEHFPNANPVEAWIAFFKSFKEITVAPGDTENIHASDWAPGLNAAAQWYFTYLQFEVGVKDRPILYGTGLRNLIHVVGRLFQLVDQAMARQEVMAIESGQLDRLVSALYGLKWIPERIRPTSLNHALHALTERVFGADAFNRAALSRMQDQFWSWAYVQMGLDGQYGAERSKSVGGEIPSLQLKNLLPSDIRKKITELNTADWNEFLKVKTLMAPLFSEQMPYVVLVPEIDRPRFGATYDFHNLSIMNILRSTVSLIFRGYAHRSAARHSWDAAITQDELQACYQDFRDLGIDLGFVDPRTTSAGRRAFIEGNLFTYSSDGLSPDGANGAELTMVEAMELSAFLYSGGIMSRRMYKEFAAACPHGAEDQYTHLPTLDRVCVQRNMIELLNREVINMPGLRAFIKSSDADLLNAYAAVLVDTAFPVKEGGPWVEPGQFSWLAVVLHYAEAIMTRYDTDRNGLLTNDEIDAAMPIFQGFIKDFAAKVMKRELWDWQAKGVLYYILVNKKMPSADTRGGWDTGLQSFGWTRSSLAMDRYELASVFKVIIGKIMEASAVVPPAAAVPAPNPAPVQPPSPARAPVPVQNSQPKRPPIFCNGRAPCGKR